jgi:hypothetical protein
MNRRSLKVAFSIAGSCVIAIVAVLALDGLMASNRMNPVPAAQSAAAAKGFAVEPLQLTSYEATGGLFGSRAVVNYNLGEAADAGRLEVQLRRPLLSREWEVVAVAKK